MTKLPALVSIRVRKTAGACEEWKRGKANSAASRSFIRSSVAQLSRYSRGTAQPINRQLGTNRHFTYYSGHDEESIRLTACCRRHSLFRPFGRAALFTLLVDEFQPAEDLASIGKSCRVEVVKCGKDLAKSVCDVDGRNRLSRGVGCAERAVNLAIRIKS